MNLIALIILDKPKSDTQGHSTIHMDERLRFLRDMQQIRGIELDFAGLPMAPYETHELFSSFTQFVELFAFMHRKAKIQCP